MALTSALYSGLSGLDVSQQTLNVVGNNIANSDTTAFKSSRALFKPQFYVTNDAGSAPTDQFGGTNPEQEGLGATVSSIDKNWSPGQITPTGQDTDMAINGQGFFVVQNPAGQEFTRDGSFTLNSSNQLVTADGSFVQGYGADNQGNILPGALQNITIPIGATTTAKATTNVALNGDLDASGAVATGASILNSQDLTTIGGAAAPTAATLLSNVASTTANGTPLIAAGDTLTLQGSVGGTQQAAQTFTVTPTSTLGDLQNFLQGGLGINTAAPAQPGQPVPGSSLVADPADPNSVMLAVTGNAGTANSLSLAGNALTNENGISPFAFQNGVDGAGNKSNPDGTSITTSFVAYDSLGSPVNVNVTAVLENKTAAGDTWQFYATSPSTGNGSAVVGNGTLTFSNTGQLTNSTGTTINIDRTGTGAKTPMSVNLNFGGVTSLASAGGSTLVMENQDGSQIGTLESFSVGADGAITGSYSNGQTKALGQVAIATFANQDGLVDQGGNEFTAGAGSGAAVISTPGQLGSGQIVAGALEQSNVDLSTEFVNMIVASTGFSAASRVISTSNQLITDLLNSTQG
jgi:flagellar hook protein FlgE